MGTRCTAALVLVLAAGCGDGAAGRAAPSPSASLGTGSPSPSASPSATASSVPPVSPSPTEQRITTPPTGSLRLDDGDDGRTVHVATGTRITVVLDTTYWTFGAGSRSVAKEDERHAPASPGSCPPGVGCGTVTGVYRAVAAGTGDITASRTLCGEAVACGDAQRSFVVHVAVG